MGLLLVGGCGSSDGSPQRAEEAPPGVRVELDKSNERALLAHYFGGYVSDEGGDAFETGLLTERSGDFYLDTTALGRLHPEAVPLLRDPAADDLIDFDEVSAWLQGTYYAARGIPPTLGRFRERTAYADTSAWMRVDLDGVMTTARRRVYAPKAAVRTALEGYADNGEQLLYPTGTVFVGEHWEGDALAEVTAMMKRADGFWDYLVYDGAGQPATATVTEPRTLDVPTQCVGCHLGRKPFEPERSFPAEATPGPHGPRALYVDPALRDLEVVRFFDEHRKRSDTILGLYGTLFVAQLRADRAAGRLAPEDAALLDELGL